MRQFWQKSKQACLQAAKGGELPHHSNESKLASTMPHPGCKQMVVRGIHKPPGFRRAFQHEVPYAASPKCVQLVDDSSAYDKTIATFFFGGAVPRENSLPSPVSERFVPRFTHGEPPSDAQLAQFPALNASGFMAETAAMLAEEGRQLTNFAVRSNSPVTTLSRRFVHESHCSAANGVQNEVRFTLQPRRALNRCAGIVIGATEAALPDCGGFCVAFDLCGRMLTAASPSELSTAVKARATDEALLPQSQLQNQRRAAAAVETVRVRINIARQKMLWRAFDSQRREIVRHCVSLSEAGDARAWRSARLVVCLRDRYDTIALSSEESRAAQIPPAT